MVDIDKQIAYWRDGAEEEWAVAQELLSHGRIRHCLFFVHLALEKSLKAHVCSRRRDFAPRIHNLVRLAETAELSLDSRQLDVLADLNEFNLEGRYPDQMTPTPSLEDAKECLARAEEVMQWLSSQL